MGLQHHTGHSTPADAGRHTIRPHTPAHAAIGDGMRIPLMPDNDRHKALRLQRQLIGLVSYLMFFVPLAHAVQQGWLLTGFGGLAAILVAAAAFGVRTSWVEVKSGALLVALAARTFW